jgi:hypothetical protein
MSRFFHPRFSPPPRGRQGRSVTALFVALLLALAPAATFALTFLTWQSDHFTPAELADSAISGPVANPDGDSLPNLHEYHFGTDPLLPDSPASPPVLETADGIHTLRHHHALAAEDSLAWLQASPDLRHWVTYGLEAEVARTELTDSTEITHADLEAFEPERRFLRLRVDLAPFDFSLRAPSGLTLTLHGPTQWELAWSDLNLAETAYDIERQSPVTGLWVPVGNTSPNQISWFHATADSAAGIRYRVLVRDSFGNTLASDPISPPDLDGDNLPDALELASAYTGAPGTYATFPGQAANPATAILDNWAPSMATPAPPAPTTKTPTASATSSRRKTTSTPTPTTPITTDAWTCGN